MRSDQLPPATDTPAFTTCSAAHMSGMNCALPAASVSFNSRNASVEFPSVNSVSTSMNNVNSRGSAVSGRLKPDTTYVCDVGGRDVGDGASREVGGRAVVL